MNEALHFHARLPAHPVSVDVTRALLRALHPLVDGDQIRIAELALSELVTNSIRHAVRGPDDPIDVQFIVGGRRLTGIVRDSGAPFLVPERAPTPDQVGGFGLRIVDTLGQLEIERTAGGNVVTFTVPPTR